MKKNERNFALKIATALNQTFIEKYNYDWLQNAEDEDQEYSIEFLCNISDKIESYLKIMEILKNYVYQENYPELVNILRNLEKDEVETCVRSISALLPVLSNLSQEDKVEMIVELDILQNNGNVKVIVSEIQKNLKSLLKIKKEKS